MRASIPISGSVAPGWERVGDLFTQQLVSSGVGGCGVAVYSQGELVVDLVGGWFTADKHKPYDQQALQFVFSTAKGVAAIAIGRCVEMGLLDYATPVAEYWPEFDRRGKGTITVGHLVSHRAGLPIVDGPESVEQLLDWSYMVRRLEQQEPVSAPGEQQCYHAITFGWLVGELVRRVDPEGRTFGGFVSDEVVKPVGAELWIGTPSTIHERISPLTVDERNDDADFLDAEQTAFAAGTFANRAMFINDVLSFRDPRCWNRPDVLAAELPAVNAVTNARSLARIYAATATEIDGQRLLTSRTLGRMSEPAGPAGEVDALIQAVMPLGMGIEIASPRTPMLGAGSIGHPGVGGSLGCVHPADELSFAYVTNSLQLNRQKDRRASRLAKAARQCAPKSRVTR